MDESLFQRLSIHENCKTELCLQYRMNEEIMSISNKLVYDGKLQCGNDTIADGKLVLPDKAVFVQMLENRGWSHSWLAEIIATQGPVNFLNTDKIPAPHEKRHTSLINKIESQLVSLLIKALLKVIVFFFPPAK
ncbi:DNA replication ATP-dependent helicase/nuclease DNA2-like [Saccoglossus kowalevskii]|uniref:DNA replication ATP-dependent helicase/nuclease n=1 Tax=Saccoglossus kowalevskii TaxID=10224 RepID=A0ABM0MZI9_SACKO|nr:PREDICTED: DNA replication ATP-dependent helicase/nuclease DNA2-like [Saccoglossus kowalevskii]